MYTTKVVLLTGKGNIANAIIDLLPPVFLTKQIDFPSEDSNAVIQHEKGTLISADVIILNLSPIVGYGEQMLSLLKELTVPVIVLHLYNQKVFADAFIKMGANAYLPVNFYSEDLLSAIDAIKRNDTFIARNVY